MPAYSYAITVDPNPKTKKYHEVVKLDVEKLTLDMLSFVGDNEFVVEYNEDENVYDVVVFKSRAETQTEVQERVQHEKQYMVEYNKRHLNTV